MWCLVQPYHNLNLIEAEEELDRASIVTSTTRKSTTSKKGTTAQLLEQAQRACPHEKTSGTGTNGYKIVKKCNTCGKILKEELTETGRKKEMKKLQAAQKALDPSYQEYLEWKRQGALEPAGVWTGSSSSR